MLGFLVSSATSFFPFLPGRRCPKQLSPGPRDRPMVRRAGGFRLNLLLDRPVFGPTATWHEKERTPSDTWRVLRNFGGA